MSVNKIILVGNVGKEPEIRTTQGGKEICSFSLATSEKWKGKDGSSQSNTEWHNIVIFTDGIVGIVKKYVHKGSKLYIEGKIQTRKWQDKNGENRYTTEVVLQGFNSTLQILDAKRDSGDDNSSSGYESPSDDYSETSDDDIPF